MENKQEDKPVCKCHVVKRWQVVQHLDETVPLYEHCPIHPDDPQTFGYYDRPLSELFKEDGKR